MVRAMLRVPLVFALIAGVTPVALADKAKTKTEKTDKKKKTTKRWNTKVNSKTRMDNMPSGWSWPPSQNMQALEKSCETKLDAASVVWKAAPQEGHIPDAITIADMKLGGVAYANAWNPKAVHKMDCQLALALENVGTDLYALGVREVKFGSIYRWSQVRVGGKTHNILSRHALGLAMDVVSFVDENGREAVVGRDYKKGDELLHAIEKTINESGKFRLVLTPQNDPVSHKDHFHLEANPDYTAAPSSLPKS
jgi:hypothetical protein